MIVVLTTPEYGRIIQRLVDRQANRVHEGKLPAWSSPAKTNDDAGTSKKRKHPAAKVVAGGHAKDRRTAKAIGDSNADGDDEVEGDRKSEDKAGSLGYTPSPDHAKPGAGSSASPVQPQDITGAKALLTIANSVSHKGAPAGQKR